MKRTRLSIQALEARELLALNPTAFANAQAADAANWSACGLADAAALLNFVNNLFNTATNGVGTDNTKFAACSAFFNTYVTQAAALSDTDLATQKTLVQTTYTDQESRSTDHANCATSTLQISADLANAGDVTTSKLSHANYPCNGDAAGDVTSARELVWLVDAQNAAVDAEAALVAASL